MKGEYGGVCGEEEGNPDYGGMVQPSNYALCVKVDEWRFGTTGLRMLAAYLAGILVEVFSVSDDSKKIRKNNLSKKKCQKMLEQISEHWSSFRTKNSIWSLLRGGRRGLPVIN